LLTSKPVRYKQKGNNTIMKKKIDMTHRYRGADTHNSVDSFKRRMRGYETKVLAERKAKEKAEKAKK
jgi:hypothetical protein